MLTLRPNRRAGRRLESHVLPCGWAWAGGGGESWIGTVNAWWCTVDCEFVTCGITNCIPWPGQDFGRITAVDFKVLTATSELRINCIAPLYFDIFSDNRIRKRLRRREPVASIDVHPGSRKTVYRSRPHTRATDKCAPFWELHYAHTRTNMWALGVLKLYYYHPICFFAINFYLFTFIGVFLFIYFHWCRLKDCI